MKRDTVQAVTLPVLVTAMSAREASGRSPLAMGDSGLVRVVTDADAGRWRRTEFVSSEDHALLIGLTQLRWALDEQDEFTAERAYAKLDPHIQSNTPRKPRGERLGRGISLEWPGWGLEDARGAYTWLVTEILQGARFVMWHSEVEHRILPGLYCRDRRTAVFAMGIMKRLRVCPKCDAPFIPDATNVDYCSVKHREAHRVDRFRWRKKRAALVEDDGPTGRAKQRELDPKNGVGLRLKSRKST
jgi:hypothetical protein